MYDFINNAVVISISKLAFAVIAPFIAYYFFLNKALIKLFARSFPITVVRPIINVASWILVTYYAIDIINLLYNFNVFSGASAEVSMDFIESGATDLSSLIALCAGIKDKQRFNV